jgi:nucleoside-diphosphate-sugar epimerase
MKVLLTGTSGLIGSAVARELLAAGHEVRALDKMAPPEHIRSMNLEMVYADITDRLSVLSAAAGCEAVLHLAAIPNPMQGADKISEVNVCGTQYILAAAEANSIPRVVLASSASIYGMAFARHPFEPDYLPMDEDHPCRPQDVYAWSKMCNEEAAATYTRRTGMTTVCLRPPLVLELGGQRARWQRRMLQMSRDIKANDMWTYIDVRDAARAFRLAMKCLWRAIIVCSWPHVIAGRRMTFASLCAVTTLTGFVCRTLESRFKSLQHEQGGTSARVCA